MLFATGAVLLFIVVLLAVVGAVPPQPLLLASFIIPSICMREVSGWLIAAAMLALYGVIAVSWAVAEELLERSRC